MVEVWELIVRQGILHDISVFPVIQVSTTFKFNSSLLSEQKNEQTNKQAYKQTAKEKTRAKLSNWKWLIIILLE